MMVQWFNIITNTNKKLKIAITNNSKIFIPANFIGSGEANAFSAFYDGIEILKIDNSIYLPLDWFKQEYPNYIKELTKIENIFKKRI